MRYYQNKCKRFLQNKKIKIGKEVATGKEFKLAQIDVKFTIQSNDFEILH
jgi:hypothetical protein